MFWQSEISPKITNKFHEKVLRLEENTPSSTFARIKRDAKLIEETVTHREKCFLQNRI